MDRRTFIAAGSSALLGSMLGGISPSQRGSLAVGARRPPAAR